MAKNKSGNTAFGVAMVRVIEQYEPPEQRLFAVPGHQETHCPVIYFSIRIHKKLVYEDVR